MSDEWDTPPELDEWDAPPAPAKPAPAARKELPPYQEGEVFVIEAHVVKHYDASGTDWIIFQFGKDDTSRCMMKFAEFMKCNPVLTIS